MKKWTPHQALSAALKEARKGASFVSPNPLVGCVILDEQGHFLSSGYHTRYGAPHAEIEALRNLSESQLKGAQVFVTLEPCAHEGKTPSCAKTLSKLPLGKVIYGLEDPNPLVCGQGAAILKAAGIPTQTYAEFLKDNNLTEDLQTELEELCEAFLWNFRQKEIFVALKIASSLDGQIALSTGESQWITGENSREFVHEVRSYYDALLVGRETIEKDNPSLNIRHPHIQKENFVIILDPQGKLLRSSQFLKNSKVLINHSPDKVFLCVLEEFSNQKDFCSSQKTEAFPKVKEAIEAPEQFSQQAPPFLSQELFQIIPCRALKNSSKIDLKSLLQILYKIGLRSLLIEGGGLTASHFLEEDLVQRLWLFQAPILLGSQGNKSWTSTLKIPNLSRKKQLINVKRYDFGADLCWTGAFKPPQRSITQ